MHHCGRNCPTVLHRGSGTVSGAPRGRLGAGIVDPRPSSSASSS